MDTLSSTDPVIPVAGWARAYVGAGWNGTEGMVRTAGKEEMEGREGSEGREPGRMGREDGTD